MKVLLVVNICVKQSSLVLVPSIPRRRCRKWILLLPSVVGVQRFNFPLARVSDGPPPQRPSQRWGRMRYFRHFRYHLLYCSLGCFRLKNPKRRRADTESPWLFSSQRKDVLSFSSTDWLTVDPVMVVHWELHLFSCGSQGWIFDSLWKIVADKPRQMHEFTGYPPPTILIIEKW